MTKDSKITPNGLPPEINAAITRYRNAVSATERYGHLKRMVPQLRSKQRCARVQLERAIMEHIRPAEQPHAGHDNGRNMDAALKGSLNAGDVYEPFIGVDLAAKRDTSVFHIQWGPEETEHDLEPPRFARNDLLDVQMKEAKLDLSESLRRAPMPPIGWRGMFAEPRAPYMGHMEVDVSAKPREETDKGDGLWYVLAATIGAALAVGVIGWLL